MLTRNQLLWTVAVLLIILGLLSAKTLFVLLSFILGVSISVALIIAGIAVLVHSMIAIGNRVTRFLGFAGV